MITLLLTLAVAVATIQGTVPGSRRKRDDDCRKTKILPKVEPANSSHVLVKWSRVFQGDCGEDLESVSVVINKNETPIEWQQQEVHVPGNICEESSVYIKIRDDHGKILTSAVRTYNKYGLLYTIYMKMLEATIPTWICLKGPGMVIVLEPPEEFAACVLTRGEVRMFAQKGKAGYVNIDLINSKPKEPKFSLAVHVTNIKECPAETTTERITKYASTETSTSGIETRREKSTSIPNSSEDDEWTGFLSWNGIPGKVIFGGVPAILITLAVAVVFLYAKCCKEPPPVEEEAAPQDFNWEYGTYAMDEEGNYTGDEQVITDSNPEYHSGPVTRF